MSNGNATGYWNDPPDTTGAVIRKVVFAVLDMKPGAKRDEAVGKLFTKDSPVMAREALFIGVMAPGLQRAFGDLENVHRELGFDAPAVVQIRVILASGRSAAVGVHLSNGPGSCQCPSCAAQQDTPTTPCDCETGNRDIDEHDSGDA